MVEIFFKALLLYETGTIEFHFFLGIRAAHYIFIARKPMQIAISRNFGYQFTLLLIAATPQQRINEHPRPAHTHLLLRIAHFLEQLHPTIT